MATTSKPIPKTPVKKPAVVKGAKTVAVKAVKVARSREDIMTDVCVLLEAGGSLNAAVAQVPDAKLRTVLDWTNNFPELAVQYAQARARGYQLLADDIIAISDEVEVACNYKGDDITLQLDATAIARNRLRVDTRKWMLSKMLPKIYGDKVTTELTGSNGGPIQIAAMNLKNISDAELNQMQELLNRSGEDK